MKTSQVALSALGTIAVAGYVLATEYPFWKKWTDDDESKSSRSESRSKSKSRRSEARERSERDKPDTQTSDTGASMGPSGSAGSSDSAAADKETIHRSGHVAYRVNMPCDCQEGNNLMLETVEFTPQHTILTILNANREELSTLPPGDEDAQFLLEWRYEGNNRPRHDLIEARRVPYFPKHADPLHFQLVFPRISDQAVRFQVSGHATNKLDYFSYASIQLTDEISLEELERHHQYGRCGFDGVAEIPVGHDKLFVAHTGPKRSGFSWTASGGLSIEGSARKDRITVRGDRAAAGEVCLEARVDGSSCRSCQSVEVTPSADPLETDFRMKTCGGIPSREPHWQFEVTEPIKGASYEWATSDGHILKGSKNKSTLVMRTSYVPDNFDITLKVSKGGASRSYTRQFHTIYSCLERSPR